MNVLSYDKDKLKTFFNYYKKFVDVALVRKDIDTYHGKLVYVGDLVKNIDFDKNILFICNRDIMKEVFLSGFLNLPTWRSFELINIGHFLDIHMGSRRADRSELRPSDMTYEDEYDILQDVLCVSCNYHEVKFSNNKLNEDVLVNTIMHRYDTVEKDSKKPLKVTWVFAFGSFTLIEKEYNTLHKFFKSKEDHPLFDIIDLNILGEEKSISLETPIKTSSTESSTEAKHVKPKNTKKTTEKDLDVVLAKKSITKKSTEDSEFTIDF